MSSLDTVDSANAYSVSPSQGRWVAWNTALFYLLVVANLIPLWAFRFPSQDGPAHLYMAVARRDYALPQRELFREFFQFNDRLVPNWICPHVMPYLVSIMPPETAEKVLMSVYLILLPLSMRYALRAIRPRAGMLAIAGIPFVPNYYYHMGFEDFCMSLPLFFFCIGYWIKHRRAFGSRNMLALTGLLLLTYMMHIVGAVMAGFFLVVLAWTMGSSGIEARLRRVSRVIISGLPTVMLTIAFIVSQQDHEPMRADLSDTYHRIKEIVGWQKAFANREIALALTNITLFAGVSAWLLWRRKSGRRFVAGMDAFLLIAVICAILFFILPDAVAGGSMLVVRVMAFVFFSLLLWWGAQPIGSRAFNRIASIITPVSAIVTILMVISMSFSYREIEYYRGELESAVAQVQSNSTLLATEFSPATIVPNSHGRWVSRGPNPFLHAAYVSAADRGIVEVDCQPATTNYFAIQFRSGLSPGPNGLEDFDAYKSQVGKHVDYVLLWTGGGTPDDELDRKLVTRLQQEYQLVFTSPLTGYAKLYHRKEASDSVQEAQVTSDLREVRGD